MDPLNFPAGKIQGHFLVTVEVRVGVRVRVAVTKNPLDFPAGKIKGYLSVVSVRITWIGAVIIAYPVTVNIGGMFSKSHESLFFFQAFIFYTELRITLDY